jgi:hypothetical protein
MHDGFSNPFSQWIEEGSKLWRQNLFVLTIGFAERRIACAMASSPDAACKAEQAP